MIFELIGIFFVLVFLAWLIGKLLAKFRYRRITHGAEKGFIKQEKKGYSYAQEEEESPLEDVTGDEIEEELPEIEEKEEGSIQPDSEEETLEILEQPELVERMKEEIEEVNNELKENSDEVDSNNNNTGIVLPSTTNDTITNKE